jgi:hypothetical protein
MRQRLTFLLAYIAGFFDGEGCVGIYTNGQRRGHSLRVQLCQNDSKETRELFDYLAAKYSAKYSEQVSLSGNVKLNLQLNSDTASKFLESIIPFLHFKKEQAVFGMQWNVTRPRSIRGAKGRYLPRTPEEQMVDKAASLRMKCLKREGFVQRVNLPI